jgi:hypothetical protein
MVERTALRLPNSRWRMGACSWLGGGGAQVRVLAEVPAELLAGESVDADASSTEGINMRSGLRVWVWEETRTQLNLATPRRCGASRGG